MIRYFWPSDDEQLAGQWTDSHFDEDGSWWANVQQCGAALALVVASVLTTASTVAAQSVFSQSQDDPAGNLTNVQFVQEEYWQNPVPPVVWSQPFVLTDDDIHVQFAQTFVPDDGDWKPLIIPDVGNFYLRLPFLDPDEIPQLPAATNPLDDGPVWTQNTPWEPTWTLLFFLDDGSTVPVFQYDEDFWQQLVPPQNWPQPSQPFTASDEDNLIPEFVAEDVFWPQFVPPVADRLLWPQPFTFEQNEQAAGLVAFTDEIFWQNPTPPVADSLYVLRQDLFDEQVPSGSLTLILDDGFQPNFVQPLPDSLRLLQQWPFEQLDPSGSLYYLRDEDFWQNPVSPVVWPQPAVFVFDEQIVAQPSSGRDEDFWNLLVPPVAAANYIALPYGAGFGFTDPEEIPAGSLFVPIPPTPVPCILPLGFDADTSISYFGGDKAPTQALFCRICNSTKPLLVRGDYAIFCQDCCAFVSKQDTFMGTVRAPGVFRGRF